MAKGKTSTAANLKLTSLLSGRWGRHGGGYNGKRNGGEKCYPAGEAENPGGNSAYMEGIFAAESPAQQRMGIEALKRRHLQSKQWTLLSGRLIHV